MEKLFSSSQLAVMQMRKLFRSFGLCYCLLLKQIASEESGARVEREVAIVDKLHSESEDIMLFCN